MLISKYHSPYPEDHMYTELLPYWLAMREIVVHTLYYSGKGKMPLIGHMSVNRLIQPHERFIKEKILNGRKPKNSSKPNGSGAKQPAPLQWVNCPLTDSDYDNLERAEDGFESLAAMLIGLVGDGYGVSVKYNFERGNFNCTIYRSPCDGNRRNLGLSGHAANVRDAILVTLYRFNTLCGGDLNDDTPVDTSSQQGRRFG